MSIIHSSDRLSVGEKGTINIPSTNRNHVNQETWDRPMVTPGKATGSQVDAFVARAITEWRIKGLMGPNLWGRFCLEFDGWNEGTFELGSRFMIETLRNQLLQYGVFVEWGRGHRKIASNPVNTLTRDDYHNRSSEELDRWHEKNYATFRSHCRISDFVNDMTIPPRSGDKVCGEMEQLPTHMNSRPDEAFGLPLQESLRVRPAQSDFRSRVSRPHLTDGYQQCGQCDALGGEYRSHSGHRDNSASTDQPSPKQLSDLSELYSGNNMKYSSEEYDVPDIQLTIVRETCHNAGIADDPSHLAVAFPFVLKGKATDFYVQRLCIRVPRDFFILVDAVRRPFETEETAKAYLAE
ncbi:hypothetical protein CH35J_012884 [Colletotrichum higginsianum]|uniref:Uncharacterized protein n=1 Tax=Colletotrichum higginsianum TaxID=80884 RepID=A0A4T0VCG3_9PEZI|nr:hypothetical protein CH35J_012884 [Colletotrichum higginsianum]